jgi:hypothetical protein
MHVNEYRLYIYYYKYMIDGVIKIIIYKLKERENNKCRYTSIHCSIYSDMNPLKIL